MGKNKALLEAISLVGGRRQLAEKLGTSRQVIEYWLKNKVPAEWVLKLESATDIPRQRFRPDIFNG